MATDTNEVLPFSPLAPVASQMQSLQGMQPIQLLTSEQQGTLRSNSTMPTTPATVLDTLPEQQGFGLNNDSVATLQAIARNSAMESNQHSSALSALEKLSSAGQTPVMQHVLSVMAALSGNFGPAMQIMEQKRKAAIGKDMFPVVSQINRLKALGKYDEATQLAEDAATRVGPQAPEIVPILGKIASDISMKQIQLQQEKTLQGVVSDQIGKDDPNRKLVDSWGKALKGGMILGAAQVGEIMSKLSPHIQRLGNQITRTPLLGGASTTETVPEAFDSASLNNTAGRLLQGDIGATANQIANTMLTGQPLIANGKVYSKDELGQLIAKYTGEQGQREVGAAVPLTPEYNAALLRVPGMTKERIATRNITPDEAEAARLEQQSTNVQLAEAPILAANRTDVTKIAGVGYTVLDGDATSASFGRRQGLITNDQLRANPNLQAVPEKLAAEKIEPALRTSDGLNYLRRMYDEMSTQGVDGKAEYSRLSTGVRRFIEGYIGTSLDPKTPLETVMRLIVDRSVEDLEKTQTVDNQVVKRLKEQLIGGFADPVGALKAVDVMQERIRSDLSRYMLKNGGNISDILKQSSTTGPTTPSYKGFYEGIVGTEASNDSDVSPKGAVGKHQIMPGTAAKYLKELNLEPDDLAIPSVNRKVAKMHMADLEAQYPNRPDLAAAAYFSGAGNVDAKSGTIIDLTKRAVVNGVPIGPTVQQYVNRVMYRMKQGQAASTLAPIVAPTTYTGRLKGINKGGEVLP